MHCLPIKSVNDVLLSFIKLLYKAKKKKNFVSGRWSGNLNRNAFFFSGDILGESVFSYYIARLSNLRPARQYSAVRGVSVQKTLVRLSRTTKLITRQVKMRRQLSNGQVRGIMHKIALLKKRDKQHELYLLHRFYYIT